MRADIRSTRAWLAAVACAGIAGAHWLAYALASHGNHAHDSLLDATGHSYWPVFGAIAMAALLAGMARPLVDGFRGQGRGTEARFAGTVLRLTVIQTIGFLALEVGERALFAQGHSLHVLSEPVVLLGLALQFVVAFGAAIIIRLLARVGELIALSILHLETIGTSRPQWLSSQVLAPRLVVVGGGPSLRAPPFVR